jgi:hypothetical protein
MGMRALASLQLSAISVSDTPVTDAGFQFLTEINGKSLRVLYASFSQLSNTGLLKLVDNCPNLNHLQIQGCSRISDSGIQELLLRSKCLKHLDISGKCAMSLSFFSSSSFLFPVVFQ